MNLVPPSRRQLFRGLFAGLFGWLGARTARQATASASALPAAPRRGESHVFIAGTDVIYDRHGDLDGVTHLPVFDSTGTLLGWHRLVRLADAPAGVAHPDRPVKAYTVFPDDPPPCHELL
jgi:hypothetical protein